MKFKNPKFLVTFALMCALICVSTFLIKIPTPSLGYIHPGDGFVLLSGFLFGPLFGGLCAGIGSALADLFAGYLIYVPATFVIKAVCAVLAGLFVTKIFQKHRIPGVILGGITAEIVMVVGYFVYEALLLGADVGAEAAIAGIPFNLIQGAFGVIVSSVLYPLIAPLYRKNMSIEKNNN